MSALAAAGVAALAATLVSGGAGLAAAAAVSALTRAPRLRYVACTAALAFALAPLPMGFAFAGWRAPAQLGSIRIAAIAAAPWAKAATADGGSWVTAHGPQALLAVYALGVAACATRLFERGLALRRILRDARPVAPARLGDGEAAALPVRVSDRVRSALLVGVRRPTVVLPARALEEMTPEQLRWVLAHEAAHARRGDNLRLLAEGVVRTLLWFNPFTAWTAALAAEAREELCDLAVLQGAGPAEPRAYAGTLLFALRLGSERQFASTLINPGKRSLAVRFKSIMTPVRPTPAKAVATFGAIGAAGIIACAAGAAAWAQAPAGGAARPQPYDITGKRLKVTDCEQIFSGDVILASGDRRIKADLFHMVPAGRPDSCGKPSIGHLVGNVVVESGGKVERGQSADIDFTTGDVTVRLTTNSPAAE